MQPVESSLLSFATSLEKPLSQLQTSVANCIFPPKNILLGNEFFLIFHKNLKVTICLELEKSPRGQIKWLQVILEKYSNANMQFAEAGIK